MVKDAETKRLRPRKRPQQERSKESIRRILAATHSLLQRDGPQGVTTPNIALESGVSVGSIYQYFPNKEAIILALYEGKLMEIREITTRILPEELAETDWRQFIRRWVHRVKSEEAALGFDLTMNEAMEHFPALRPLSRAHADLVASIIAGHLRRLGSPWPEPALQDLATYLVFMNSGLWLYWSHAGRPLPQGIDRLAEAAIAVVAPAMNGEAVPEWSMFPVTGNML